MNIPPKPSEMDLAMAELANDPELLAAAAERERKAIEWQKLYDTPVIMRPEKMGLAQKSNSRPIFVLKLSAPDPLKEGECHNYLTVPKDAMGSFVMEELEFTVETIISSPEASVAIQWIHDQERGLWSLTQRLHRNPMDPNPFIFSFDDKEMATLFKLFHG